MTGTVSRCAPACGVDGPTLPIEFSRCSEDGRLTAVIDRTCGADVPTRFTLSAVSSVADAREELRVREGRTRRSWIGFIDLEADEGYSRVNDAIPQRIRVWLEQRGLRAALWTDIPPDFGGDVFSVDAAVAKFESSVDPIRTKARNYIAWAPSEVETPLRHALRERGLLDGAGAPPPTHS